MEFLGAGFDSAGAAGAGKTAAVVSLEGAIVFSGAKECATDFVADFADVFSGAFAAGFTAASRIGFSVFAVGISVVGPGAGETASAACSAAADVP